MHFMNYRNILLIDDDIDDHEIFMAALARVSRDVKCMGFTNDRETLQKLENGAITTDVIFLDLNMPIMSGQQFLYAIKQIPGLRDIPVVILSTSSNPTTIQVTKDLGAIKFITKPDKFDGLIHILEQFLS